MPYLNCPSCRLTVYCGPFDSMREDCPRCRAKLGKASRLFRSALPQRLLEADGRPAVDEAATVQPQET